jgi:hypothetical protein
MNGYQIIIFFLLVLLCVHVLDLKPHIQQLAAKIVDIPPLTHKGSNPAMFDLAVRLAYLIAIVGIIKLLVTRRRDNDDK